MFKIKTLFTLAFSFFASTAFAGDTPPISQQELLTALKASNHNIVVLDVRSEGEYNQGHIANAINVSHDLVKEKLGELTQYKDSTVVVYCRSGRRAAFAESILAKNGFSDLRHLSGDMNGWVEAELPVVSSEHSH